MAALSSWSCQNTSCPWAWTLDLFRKERLEAHLIPSLQQSLLQADVGLETTEKLLKNFQNRAPSVDRDDPNALFDLFKKILVEHLQPLAQPLPWKLLQNHG